MLVFAGFVPATPLLLPSVAGERLGEIKKTSEALNTLLDHFTVTKPTDLIIVAGGAGHAEAISVEVADPYTTSLAAVGDLGYSAKYHPSFPLIDALQRASRKSDFAFTLDTAAELNLSTTIALEKVLGRRHLPIVPVLTSRQDLKHHFRFGELLREVVSHSNRRVALICTGNLGHVEGNPTGTQLNDTIENALVTRNASGLLQITDELRLSARETCLKELAVLFGALADTQSEVKLLSREDVFGVGLMVADFTLPL